MRKLFLFFVGLLFSLSASAAIPVNKWFSGWLENPQSEGRAHLAQNRPNEVIVRVVSLPGSQNIGGKVYTSAQFWLCPRGQSRLNLATEMCEDGEPGICEAKKGTFEVINTTSGWKRTPKVDDYSEEWVYTYKLPPGGVAKVCGDSYFCEMVIDAAEPCPECGAYVSQVPGANGLYRVSTDFRGHFTGELCTSSSVSDLPSEALHSDDVKDPPCPGYVGEVNGVRGCFGTAAKPVRPVAPPAKPSGHGAGDAGNPTAGPKPSAGAGSGSGGAGRTPSTGTGGSGGGPSGAASGSGVKPDGNTNKPGEGKEQANCGAPGQPRCQIDESGTPNGSDSKDKLTDAVNKAGDEQKAAIENASKLKADGWTFSFALPSGCTALTLAGYQIPGQGALSIDVCKWQPMIHDVMTMLWLICTVWGCINMVGSTQRSS